MTARKDTLRLIHEAAEAANDSRAADIVALDVSDSTSVTEAFLIATGSSARQVIAIAENIEKRLYKVMGTHPLDREGVAEGSWILLDYGDFVIHVFDEKARDYYDLENLWGTSPRIELHLQHTQTVHSGEQDDSQENSENYDEDNSEDSDDFSDQEEEN